MALATGKHIALLLFRIRLKKGIFFLNVIVLSLVFNLMDFSISFAQIDHLEMGDRVRITSPILDSPNVTGTVSNLSNETVLALSVNKDSLFFISHYLIQDLKISRGRKRVIGRGILIGAVAGAWSAGLLSAYANYSCGFGDRFCVSEDSKGAAFVSSGTTGLIVGAVAGAITGFFTYSDRWKRIPVDAAVVVRPHKTKSNQFVTNPEISFRIPISKR